MRASRKFLIFVLKDCNTLVRMCGILISGLANRFSSFRPRKKISFHRPVSVREHHWNLVKGVLDHLWAILAVYFLKVIVKLDVDAFVLGVAKKSEVPICSASTSFTNPSSFVKQVLEQLQETLDYANCKETSTNYHLIRHRQIHTGF